MDDEAAWLLAGKLRLIDHLRDVRLGCAGVHSRRLAHNELTAFGYDMDACDCIPTVSRIPIRFWETNPV